MGGGTLARCGWIELYWTDPPRQAHRKKGEVRLRGMLRKGTAGKPWPDEQVTVTVYKPDGKQTPANVATDENGRFEVVAKCDIDGQYFAIAEFVTGGLTDPDRGEFELPIWWHISD